MFSLSPPLYFTGPFSHYTLPSSLLYWSLLSLHSPLLSALLVSSLTTLSPFSLFAQFRNFKIVYRRYAGLFFCICVDLEDSNLGYLEAIHNFVEV